MEQGSHDTQRSTVLSADALLGPYEIVRAGFEPLGMSAGVHHDMHLEDPARTLGVVADVL